MDTGDFYGTELAVTVPSAYNLILNSWLKTEPWKN